MDIPLEAFPPVLPYLLLTSTPKTPLDLLRAAKSLRNDELMIEYREWRQKMLRNWIDHGLIEARHETEIKRVLVELKKRLDIEKKIELELGVGVSAGEKGIGIDVGIKVPLPVGRIWGWTLEQLPGHRYLKILKRLKLAETQYIHMDRALKTVWNNA